MDRRNSSPDRNQEEQVAKSLQDKSMTLEQHMRMFGQRYDQQVHTELDGQTEKISSNALDKGKDQLPPLEECLLNEWLKSLPIGENGQLVPRIDLATTFAPNRLILVGGMDGRGETSQADDDNNKRLCGEASLHCVRGNYRDAARKLQQVLDNCKKDKNFGPRHPRTAVAMTDLADVYAMARNFKEAKKGYKKAFDIYVNCGLRNDRRTDKVHAKLYLGEQVGRYRLVKFLGLGGFANVYLGEHADAKGIVKERAAVKLLQDTTPETVEDFRREAGTLIQLDHSHIVRGLEFSTTEHGVPYLVMKYVPDGTLRDAHPEGIPVPPGQVVEYVMQTASALQFIHGRKLMHLDLSSANILLVKEPDGKVSLELSDFGLVRVAHSTASQSSIKRWGGTPAYMDPAILRDGYASQKSDQRALAVLVCELFSGKRDQGLCEMIRKWSEIDKCPRELRSVPDKVREVLFRALAPEPKDRFSSVGTFASSFVAACAEYGVSIGDHLLPMMQEIKKHVEAQANNAQVRVIELDNEMRTLQQENEDLQKQMEGNERIKDNLRKRVGELERQRSVDQQGGSWRQGQGQEQRALQEEIDELNHKIQTIEEEKEHLKIEIEENRKFYEGNMDDVYNRMLDQHRVVTQQNQELAGSNQALQRDKQDLIDQRDRDLQRKQQQEKQLQDIVQLFEQQSLQQGNHGASTSRTSSLAKGEASSLSSGREGIKRIAEQQRKEEQIDSETRQKEIKRLYDSGEQHRMARRYHEALNDYNQVLARIWLTLGDTH